jgi:hypothetical protein
MVIFGNALDPLNENDSPSILRSPRLPAEKLLLSSIFRNYKKNDLVNFQVEKLIFFKLNGTILTCVSHYPYRGIRWMKSGEAPEQERVLQVSKYTKEEFSLVVSYYAKAGLITENIPSKTRDYAYYLHEGLGGPLLPYCKTIY